MDYAKMAFAFQLRTAALQQVNLERMQGAPEARDFNARVIEVIEGYLIGSTRVAQMIDDFEQDGSLGHASVSGDLPE